MLPAGGATLSWFLLMTLWMPLLNYAQSYNGLVHRVVGQLTAPGCVETLGLGQGQIAALGFYGDLHLKALQNPPHCAWLLVEPQLDTSTALPVDLNHWSSPRLVQHPAYAGESLLLFKRR